MRSRLSYSCLAGLISGCMLLPGGAVIAQKAASPELQRILGDWRNRQARLPTVRYVVEGRHVIGKGSKSDPVTLRPIVPESPVQDMIGTKSFTLLLDIPTGRYRLGLQDPVYSWQKKAWYTRNFVYAFDGKALQSATPRQGNVPPDVGQPTADVSVTTGNARAGSLTVDRWPPLFGHGIVPTSLYGVVPGARLCWLPDARMLSVAGHAPYRGRDCIVVRTHPLGRRSTSYDEYWVDPEHESAVLRFTHYSDGKALADMEINYASTAFGWLTKGWTYTFRLDGRTMYYDKMRVQQMDPNPPLDDQTFQVDIKPGMTIAKYVMSGDAASPVVPTITEQAYYGVGEDGKLHLLKTVIQPESHGWPLYLWGVMALVCAVLVLLGGRLLYRRYHGESASTGGA